MLITHGHEDHIGATPYLLPEIGAPVYGTDLTLALIETKLAEHKCEGVELNVIKAGDTVTVGVFKIEAIRVTHSIDAALGFAIHTPGGIIVHTGDFKVDYTPVDGRVIDIAKFAQLGNRAFGAAVRQHQRGKPGYTMSESKWRHVRELFQNATGRISSPHSRPISTARSSDQRVKRYGASVPDVPQACRKSPKSPRTGYLDLTRTADRAGGSGKAEEIKW